MADSNQLLIILTEGKADNGRKGTLAFAMGLSSLAMEVDVTIFLTSDAAVWGYEHSAYGIAVPGFSPLEDLIQQYVASGGKLFLCSTCQLTCGAGDPRIGPNAEKLPAVEIVGMATVVELAMQGRTMSF